MKATFATALLLTCFAACAAEPVTVLGLPLGGKIKPKRSCQFASVKQYSEQGLCWVYATSSGKSGARGQLHIPDEDKRPKWAAYAEFKADVSSEGILRELTVIPTESENPGAIINSISARFGRPTSSQLKPPTEWYAAWERPDIGISLLCQIGSKCNIRFTSIEVALEERKNLRQRMKIDAARPTSP